MHIFKSMFTLAHDLYTLTHKHNSQNNCRLCNFVVERHIIHYEKISAQPFVYHTHAVHVASLHNYASCCMFLKRETMLNCLVNLLLNAG